MKHYPLDQKKDLDPLIESIGDARVVMLGEASHGTSEFYTWRTAISQRLIEERGFSFIAVEGDWPDCYAINRYVKGYTDHDSAAEALGIFNRWPTWMWANWEVAALVEWLRSHNSHLNPKKKIGFYGLDVYSLWESLNSILNYLEKNDGMAVSAARKAFQCFEPFNEDPQSYARSTVFIPENCEEDVLGMLNEIIAKMPDFKDTGDREAEFNTLQNAIVAVNAEKYYRTMVRGGAASWNVRDRHMMETLDRLMEFHGTEAKGIVWEHNTHIGDARATDMSKAGMVNIGQLAREEYGAEEVRLIGFGSYRGQVVAGAEWGAPMQKMVVPDARISSVEYLLHKMNSGDKFILAEDMRKSEAFNTTLGHRAIGVVYNPDHERYGNYVPTMLPERYDAFLFIDETTALHPFHIHHIEKGAPELYPWNY